MEFCKLVKSRSTKSNDVIWYSLQESTSTQASRKVVKFLASEHRLHEFTRAKIYNSVDNIDLGIVFWVGSTKDEWESL